MTFEEKLEVLTSNNIVLQERVTYITQYSNLPLTIETLEQDRPESDQVNETYYEASETDYILWDDPNGKILVEGSIEEIKQYITTTPVKTIIPEKTS